MSHSPRKIALVTGASRGLGRNAALHLARTGRDVVITYRARSDEAAAAKQEIEALGGKAAILALDVADVASFADFAQRLADVLDTHWERRSFDFLVNNAGISGHMALGATEVARFDALVDVHFRGAYFLTQALLPLLADGGAIVCVSTALTRITMPGGGPYGAVKAAVESLVRVWAKELGPRRIRVNAVAPGAIATDFSRAVYEARPELKDQVAAATALGRMGEPDDIGPVVAFLCSEGARWVNGQRVEASGGMVL